MFPPPRCMTEAKSERCVRDMLTPSTMMSMTLNCPLFFLRTRQSTDISGPFWGIMDDCTRTSALPSGRADFTVKASPLYSLKRRE